MITHIKGKLIEKTPTYVVIDCNGIGYKIKISLQTFSLIKEENCSLYTHLSIKEDSHTLYGFYNENERQEDKLAIGNNAEITGFKGLGEISPHEFKNFIGRDMRLDPVILGKESSIHELLKYYMGKNSKERQDFIIDNLRSQDEN